MVLFLGITPTTSFAQKKSSKTSLQKKKDKLNKDIKYTSTLLDKTKKSQQDKERKLQIINNQIKLRQELIETISVELNHIVGEISILEEQINLKSQEVEKLKQDYAKMLRFAQKNQSNLNAIVYVLGANDFYQSYRRLKHLKQYTDYRKQQAVLIYETQEQLQQKVETLAIQRSEKEVLLATQTKQSQQLTSDKSNQVSTINELKQEEGRLKRKLQAQKKEKQKIQKQLEDLIRAEITKSKSKNNGKFKLSPEAKILSDKFAQNKGKLPWPVEKGVITGRFGKQAHAVLKNITIENNGIDITTNKEAPVRAIFKGEVNSVLVIPGAGKVVVINHGAYRTIYTNLKDVLVKKGDLVDLKEYIGTSISKDGSDKSDAHLEIWRIGQNGVEKLNPLPWLAQ